jgi:hypothetical protein
MEPLAIRRIVGAVLAVATSGLVSVFAFYAAELLYKPQPVQLDVLIGPPVNGALKPGKHLHEPIASPERSTPFNLISGNVEGGEAEWLSPDGQLETRWNSTSTDVPFTASIRLFDGCMQIKDYLHAAGPTPAFTLSNPRDLKVWFDQGASNLHIFNEKNQGRFKVVTDTILMYWVDRDERNNTIKLVEFVTQDDHLEFKQPPDAIEFFVSAYRFGADGTSATIRNRTLHIQSGEHEESIEFEGTFDRKENIACKELPTHELLLGEKTTIPESSAVVGVLVRIERGPTSIYNSDDNELRAVNGSGWISIDGLRDKDLSQAKPGDVSFIEFAGNIINLEVDGAQVTRNPAARYFSFGDFEGSFKRGGQLRFLGIAKALFKDRSRMNPTKWESLGWDRCAFLLGVIGSLLAAVAKFTTSVLKKNLSFGWLSL